jgi:hypothetical protein
MSTYLREMNPQVWWMVDAWISHVLGDCPQIQVQKKFLYLKAHVSNGLSSALSAEIKDEIKMEYGWTERDNLFWKVLEQLYGSSNSRKSLLSAAKNILSLSTHFDQDQEEQLSVQKEELNSTSLGKSDGPVSQTGGFGFDRIENVLSEEDDYSMSSSDIDDDDDTDDEHDEQEILMEFKKLISKHMKL